MFEKEFREWFEINKKWLFSSDPLQAAYFAWCAGIKQQQAAEQPLALDLALPPAKDDTYKIEWLDGETVRLTPSQ